MIELYEDNAGGLHMTDRKQVAYIAGQEPNLINDMATFNEWVDGMDPECLSAYDPYQYMLAPVHMMKRVAVLDDEHLEIFFDKMGFSAKAYAGLKP